MDKQLHTMVFCGFWYLFMAKGGVVNTVIFFEQISNYMPYFIRMLLLIYDAGLFHLWKTFALPIHLGPVLLTMFNFTLSMEK